MRADFPPRRIGSFSAPLLFFAVMRWGFSPRKGCFASSGEFTSGQGQANTPDSRGSTRRRNRGGEVKLAAIEEKSFSYRAEVRKVLTVACRGEMARCCRSHRTAIVERFWASSYLNLANSARADLRMGMSGSASFHWERKS